MSLEFHQVKELFLTALEKGGAPAREAFLGQACGHDPALRRQVETLLRTYDEAGGFLETPPVPPGPCLASSSPPPTEVGPYRLLEQIGEGGMGTVYLAEQTRPVQRQVALKLIRPGMDSEQVLARFEAERQALALMDHPGIARVLDAGTTAEGRPYFVMELVRGVPITRYCDEHRLPPRQRLDLFVEVCQAVQHAHLKGIIHRDLKPSNVLVAESDGKPVVKVIDFGIAKATGQKLTERTLQTSLGAIIGTLEYMSPEQADPGQVDVDTRSDVYSLGVLLYELLTGTTPFDRRRLKEMAFLEVLRRIREEEPPRPSTRLSTTEGLAAIATSRNLEPRRLAGLVKGDLDWVAMKALEKDRHRRYETASGLAADVQRYLADEPVQACPPSAGYRVRKFLRRNRAAVTAAAALAAGLLVAVGSAGLVAQSHASQRATTEREVALALEEVSRQHQEDNWVEAQAALRRAEALLSAGTGGAEQRQKVERWRTDLSVVARLEEIRLGQAVYSSLYIMGVGETYGKAFQTYGVYVEAADPADPARRIRDSAIKRQLVAALHDWCWGDINMERPTWKRLFRVAQLADPDPWRDRFMDAYQRQDRKALVAMAREEGAEDLPPDTALLLARALERMKEAAVGIELCRRVQLRNPADPWLNVEIAKLLQNSAQGNEAIGYWRAFLAARPRSGASHASFAKALASLGRLGEAEVSVRETLRLQPESFEALNVLGHIRAEQGRLPEAEAALKEACRREPGACFAHYQLAHVLKNQGKLAEAEPVFRRALELRPSFGFVHGEHAELLTNLARFADAVEAYRKAAGLNKSYAGMLKEAERRLALDRRLPDILAGKAQPRDPDEKLMLGDLCARKQLYRASARFFAEGIAADPKAVQNPFASVHRYNAACAAALAGSGKGGDVADLPAAEQARLRRQALAWLEEDLSAIREWLEKDPRLVASKMKYWQQDLDFVGVRGEKALALLPEDERQGWEQFWREVESLRQKALGIKKG